MIKNIFNINSENTFKKQEILIDSNYLYKKEAKSFNSNKKLTDVPFYQYLIIAKFINSKLLYKITLFNNDCFDLDDAIRGIDIVNHIYYLKEIFEDDKLIKNIIKILDYSIEFLTFSCLNHDINAINSEADLYILSCVNLVSNLVSYIPNLGSDLNEGDIFINEYHYKLNFINLIKNSNILNNLKSMFSNFYKNKYSHVFDDGLKFQIIYVITYIMNNIIRNDYNNKYIFNILQSINWIDEIFIYINSLNIKCLEDFNSFSYDKKLSAVLSCENIFYLWFISKDIYEDLFIDNNNNYNNNNNNNNTILNSNINFKDNNIVNTNNNFKLQFTKDYCKYYNVEALDIIMYFCILNKFVTSTEKIEVLIQNYNELINSNELLN